MMRRPSILRKWCMLLLLPVVSLGLQACAGVRAVALVARGCGGAAKVAKVAKVGAAASAAGAAAKGAKAGTKVSTNAAKAAGKGKVVLGAKGTPKAFSHGLRPSGAVGMPFVISQESGEMAFKGGLLARPGQQTHRVAGMSRKVLAPTVRKANRRLRLSPALEQARRQIVKNTLQRARIMWRARHRFQRDARRTRELLDKIQNMLDVLEKIYDVTVVCEQNDCQIRPK